MPPDKAVGDDEIESPSITTGIDIASIYYATER